MKTVVELVKVLEERIEVCDRHGPYKSQRRLMMGREMPFNGCRKCADEKLRAEEEAARREEEVERKRRSMEELFRRACIPKRFEGRGFDNYKAENKGQERALKTAREYAEQFDDVFKSGRCLLFCGNAGNGKTHLAAAIANHIMGRGRSALFTGALEVIKRMRATWDRDAEETELQVMRALRDVDLLIIDEVGTQFNTEAEQLQAFEIINARYMDVRPMLLISNLQPDALESVLGTRTMDRLRENDGALVLFDWDSYRRKA